MRNAQKTAQFRVYFPVFTLKEPLCFYILLGAFFCSSHLFGQLDSLQQRLTELPENTEKVDILNQLSYEYHRKDGKWFIW